MTFTWLPYKPTAEEAEAFAAAIANLGKSWGGGFEQLAVYLDALGQP
jgi:hypothetical protein